jgi:hypothetical protein
MRPCCDVFAFECSTGTDCADCGPAFADGGSDPSRADGSAPPSPSSSVQSVVVSTGRQQHVYHDQEVLFLSATLLHPTATALRWSNQMRSDGADYYLSLVDHSTLALRRAEPSCGSALPGPAHGAVS